MAVRTVSDIGLHTVPIVGPEAGLRETMALTGDDPLKVAVVVGNSTYMGLFVLDAARDLVPADANIDDLTVGPYLHPSKVVLTPEMDIESAIAHLRRKGMTLAPVVASPIYKGIVTLGDLEAAA